MVGRAPDLAEIERLAQAARDALPAPFRAHAQAVAIRVEEWPDDATLDALDIADAYDLTGLYEGVPLIEKSVGAAEPQADLIWLFRRPILDEWAGRGDVTLGALVAHVYIHELAHHLGWSDADIAAVDRWWE